MKNKELIKMKEDKNTQAINRIKEEIAKIEKNENHIYFYVIDTEGYPSGSLAYIYQLAKFLNDDGYNVTMLYQTEGKGKTKTEFVGVGAWLGEEYAKLPHKDVMDKDVEISASDILFIPEIYSQVMNQTKNLPCKRIAIMQNYDYILAQTPFSSQWSDYKIFDAISNTSENAKLLQDIFPYENVSVIDPYIENRFGTTKEPKKMIVNVIARNQDDVTRIMKPFYWKYPYFKWVSFKDLRAMSKDNFANALREGCITIWIDEDASFGYSAIEAMKSGNVVFGKLPKEYKKWMLNEDGSLNNSCIWFDTLNVIPDQLATVIRAFITNTIPNKIFENQEYAKNLYSMENTKKQIIDYIKSVNAERKNTFTKLINVAENNKDNNENND